MLRALELEGTERVLDVGGASGYQAALLSRLAREVVSVEMDDDLVRLASSALEALGRDNVRIVHADVVAGWPSEAPYDAIVVWVGFSEYPQALIDQLALGGRLVIPLGDADAQLVWRLHKRFDGVDSETIGSCRVDVLTSSSRASSSFPWSSHRR
jgi:protein-L-isoaspartate(D-aspartate) O-methyltransferase